VPEVWICLRIPVMRIVMLINTVCSSLFDVAAPNYRTSSFSRPQGERHMLLAGFLACGSRQQIHLPGQ
jgi:hypothetical protein